MLPISPPLPLIQSTLCSLPSSGSRSAILALVLPPPKFVIRRSDPRRFERYLSSSASLNLRAISSSHRSSRYCSFSCTLTGKDPIYAADFRKVLPLPHEQLHYLQNHLVAIG